MINDHRVLIKVISFFQNVTLNKDIFLLRTFSACVVGNVTYMKISRRIELRTLKKILEFSLTNGPQKKTNMATNCKMSYSRFIPLLNIMEILGLLDVVKSTGNYIVITDIGKIVLEKLQKNQMVD